MQRTYLFLGWILDFLNWNGNAYHIDNGVSYGHRQIPPPTQVDKGELDFTTESCEEIGIGCIEVGGQDLSDACVVGQSVSQ